MVRMDMADVSNEQKEKNAKKEMEKARTVSKVEIARAQLLQRAQSRGSRK